MDSSSPLFATKPVADAATPPPVVVVGLPRSGSTYLAHLMSCIDDWYVFDDLYVHRQARACGADGPLSETQLERLVTYLSWQLRARIKFEDSFLRPRCSLEDVDRMERALLETLRGRRVEWYELLREWLVRIARHHGAMHWGWKTPQDFFHMDMLARLFPGIRFVFLLRDPRHVLASFKFVNDKDGERGQYHPWIYARYWRLAAEKMEGAERSDLPVHRVLYEHLVSHPAEEADRIAAFLGASRTRPLPPFGANTSFREGRRVLTETETWILERTAGQAMHRLGYPLSGARPSLRSLPDLAWTTARFLMHQATRLRARPETRASVRTFLRSALSGRSPSLRRSTE